MATKKTTETDAAVETVAEVEATAIEDTGTTVSEENTEAVKNTSEPAEVSYSFEQLICSERYASRRDLLGAILDKGKSYTIAEVDNLLGKFMKGRVR